MNGCVLVRFILACGILSVTACKRAPDTATPTQNKEAAANVYDMVWTDSVAKRTAALTKVGKLKYELPQLRAYDAAGRLVYALKAPWDVKSVGAQIDKAIAVDEPIEGPSLQESLAQLQTRDGRPATAIVTGEGKITLVDYWASWCLPCKVLEKELRNHASSKAPGSIQIVKAETDIMKAMLASGQTVTMMTKDQSGKVVRAVVR